MADTECRLCDFCGVETFDAARLDYENDREDRYGYLFPSHVGDWSVLCETCAKTHKCIVVARDAPGESLAATPAIGPELRVALTTYRDAREAYDRIFAAIPNAKAPLPTKRIMREAIAALVIAQTELSARALAVLGDGEGGVTEPRAEAIERAIAEERQTPRDP